MGNPGRTLGSSRDLDGFFFFLDHLCFFYFDGFVVDFDGCFRTSFAHFDGFVWILRDFNGF